MASKFENLILYICEKSADDIKLGRTKLNKLLYYSDFFHYQKTGESITGEEYMAIQEGPVPRQMLPTLNRLYEGGKLSEEPVQAGPYTLHRQIAECSPDLSDFSAEEISTVDEFISIFRPFGGKDLSNFTHAHPGYIVAGYTETIPLATVYYPVFMEFTEEDRTLTKELAKRHGWYEKYPSGERGGVGELSSF